MDDYINRQETIEALGDVPYVSDTWTDEYAIGEYHQHKQDKAAIESVPSADVAPARHGRWIRVTKDGVVPQEYRCDVCGRLLKYEGVPALLPIRYPYCHCGARMDGEEE